MADEAAGSIVWSESPAPTHADTSLHFEAYIF